MSIVGTIVVENLPDTAYRATLMLDNISTDPGEFVEELQRRVEEYLERTGAETLEDAVCGAVNAVAAAAGVVEIARNFEPAMASGDFGEVARLLAIAQITLDSAEHARDIHGDPMAVECFPADGDNGSWLEALEGWVAANQPELDADAFLASLDLEASLVGAPTDSEDQESEGTPDAAA